MPNAELGNRAGLACRDGRLEAHAASPARLPRGLSNLAKLGTLATDRPPNLTPVVARLGIDAVRFGMVMMTIVTLRHDAPGDIAMDTVRRTLHGFMDDDLRAALRFLAAVVLLVIVLILVPGRVAAEPGVPTRA
jgi:hypothetical protein